MAAAGWSPSATVSESGTRYGYGQDVGPDGTGTVVWSTPLPDDAGYAISAREVGVDGGAGTRRAISEAAPGAAYTSAYAPTVHYDAAGTATVVWQESTYSSESCFAESGEGDEECVVDEYVRARQVDAAGSLSPVRELQHRQTVFPEEGSFGGTSTAYVTYGQPLVAGGPGDTLTVLWPESTFDSGCAAYGYSRSYVDSECEADQKIKWVRLSAAGVAQGTAQTAFESHASGYGSGEPLLRLRAGAAGDGTVTVLFRARRDAGEGECWGGESSIGFFRIESDGDAGASEELDSGCGVASPDLAVDPSGAAVAVWGWLNTYSGDEALYTRIDPAGSASAPQTLLDSEEGASVSGLDVARGAPGAALAVWAAEGGIRSRVIPFAGELDPTALIASPPAGRYFFAPRLAAGPDGSAVVVWESAIEGGRYETALQATALGADGTPHSPRTLLAANRWDHGARVSGGPSGTFLASWRISIPGRNRIQSARFGVEPLDGNDAFAGAQPLEAELPSFASGSNVGASKETGEGDHAGEPGGASVWFSWTAAESGPVTLATCASEGLDPALAVYSGGSLAALAPVAAAGGGAPRPCSAGDAAVRFEAAAGTTYRIAVDGEEGSEGTFGLKLVTRENAPANDAFDAARQVSGGLPRYLSGSNLDASREAGEPEHAGGPGAASVWYSWTADANGKAQVQVCGSSLGEPLLGVYTGSTLAALTEVGSGAPGGCGSVEFEAAAGTTYRIAVDGKDGREGRFQLRFAQTPANDDLADAQILSGLFASVSGSNVAATKESGEPDHANDPGGASVWYSWTPHSNVTAFVSACLFAGSKESALLAVYTGSGYGDLEQVGADVGSGSTTGCYSGRSEVRVEFVAGTKYLFAVDGEGGVESSFSLAIEPIPANDSRLSPQVVGPFLPTSVSGSNRHATKEAGEPAHAGDPGGASVWYSWTPGTSGTAFLSACMFAGKDQSALLSVYTGSDPEHLTEVTADAGGGSTQGCFSRYSKVSFSFQAGTRYLIALDGPGGLESSFSISFETGPANDDFLAAQPIVGNVPQAVNGSSRHATKELEEPNHAGNSGGASVWYSWTPSESGIAVLSACGQFGGEPPLLAVYGGESLATLSEVDADAGSGEGCYGGSSEVEFDVVAGESYYIALDDSAAAGLWGFKLELDLELTPANDAFAAAEQISASSSWLYSSNRHASKELEEPNHAGNSGGASVWFKWTPAEDGLYAISTCSDGALDPLLAVYTGATLGGLGAVAGDDDGGNCSDDDAEVRFEATAGTTYRIAVDGKSASTGYFELRIVTAPENDDFAAATELSGAAPQFASGSNWLATKESGEPDHANDPGGASVWYSWTPSESTTIQLTVCSYSRLDPLLAVYTGSSPAGLSPVASEAVGEDPECYGSSTRLKLDVQGNTTYRIAVDGHAGSYGEFSLRLRDTPANDDFADAEALDVELPQTAYGDNRVASAQPDEPEHGGVGAAASVWYSWTPTASGTVRLSTCSYGMLDPLLAVYAGPSLATLEEIAADDDDGGSGCSDDDAGVRFEATAGTTYLIAVDAKDGNGGWFELQLRAAGPANDDFADAIEIAPGAGIHPGTTVGAGSQSSEPGSPYQSVWYRMQADHNGTVRLHTCSDTGEPMDLDVFTGSSLITLSSVAVEAAGTASACDSTPGTPVYGDTPSLAFKAAAGTVYWISVDRYQQLSPSYELRPPGPFVLVVNAPANDLRAAAERIPYSGASLARANVGATHEPSEDEHAGDPGGASVWFRWFASATGPAQIETCGSEVDTLLAVYGQGGPPDPNGEGGAGEQYGEEPPSLPPPAPGGALASSDDSDLCGEGSTQSSLELTAQEGQEYLIAVDGKAGETGQIQVNVVFETPDTTPPDTHASIPSAINTHQLTFSLSRDEPESSFECALDGAPFTPCDLSGSDLFPYGTVSGLEEGTHTLAVREVDAAGNPDPTPESREFKVDMVPPQTSFSSGPEGLTRFLGSFGLAADEPASFFECALDDAPLSFCKSPYFLPGLLPDGQYTVRAVAIDKAGNRDPSPATRTFDLDRTPPIASIEGPEGTVEVDRVEFEFFADEEATFECELDGKAVAECESPRSFPGLADAEHRFEVVSTDLAGNIGAAVERVFRVEARPPETTIKAGPAPRVASAAAGFAFRGDEDLSGFECALDGEAFEECEEELELSGLAEGPHRLLVRAVDLAGKRDPTPVQREWVVDTLAPETTIDFGPSGLTRFGGPFEFSADEEVDRFECAVDGSEEFFTCFPGYSNPALPDGEHTLLVRAVDLAGNVDPTPSEATFDLDTTPPAVQITSALPPLTQSEVSIEFEVDDPEATTRCRVDGHLDVACVSPFEFRGIEDGPHRITVTATDPAGNQHAVTTEEFTVDEQPPETWVDTDFVYGPGPVFLFFSGSADATEYRCSLDEEPFSECVSPLELEDLPDGEHRLRVYAIDGVGNVDPTPDEGVFMVDTVPPETTILAGPEGPVHELTPSFSFESSEDLGKFECSMDGSGFRSCDGIEHDRSLGAHLFEVRAFDLAGNVDPTPASFPFTFVNQAPAASLELDRTAGPGPLEVAAGIEATDGDDDPLSYKVQFGDGTSSSGFLPHAALSHTYEDPGVYVVRLEVSDGFEKVVRTETVTVGPPEPLSARAGDDRTAVAGDPIRLDGSNSRPLRGIHGYAWSFGDGGTGSGETADHVYEQPGTYEAQLTITRNGEEATDAATITVVPPAPGTAKVTVLGDGSPLSGAEVVVRQAGGSDVKVLTDGTGVARLHGLADGTYTTAAYKPGYLPKHGELTVANGTGAGQVELHAGELVTATVESHPMTLEEIEAAGIDPNDPDNQHVYEFEVHLDIDPPSWAGQPSSYDIEARINRRGFATTPKGCIRVTVTTCRSSVGGSRVYTHVEWVEGVPLLSSLVIPFRATFLKEFYDVSLIVNNLAPAGFDLRNGSASIEVPGGMSLAPTAKPQSLDVSVPDIPGGGSATVHWILRGDKEGEYHVAAHYGATLEPFGRSIKLDARTAEPIKVWGGSALKLEVDVDDASLDGYPFKVFVKLRNVADVPVYNPAVELLKKGRVGYIEQPRQQRVYGIRELVPGAVHTAGPFVLVPEPSGKVDLTESFIRKTAGDVDLGGTIVTHPRSPKFDETPQVEVRGYGDKLVLDWEPVAGAGGYQIFRTFDREVDFPDDPLAVGQLDPTKAVVRGIDPDQPAFYGISSLLNPQEMVHPLTFGRGKMNQEWPKLAVDAGDRCDSRDMAVNLRFEALDFELASYEMTLNDLPFGSSQPLDGYSGSATVHVPFATGEENADFEVTVRDAEGTERTVHENLACDYVALGDSFASGEGVPGFEQESHQDGNHCHRSNHAYSELLVDDDSLRSHVGDWLSFHACSGAVIENMFEPNDGNHGNEGPQLNHLDAGTHLVTLSIGGNDMKFGDTVRDCTLGEGLLGLDPYCRNNHEEGIRAGRERVEEKLPQILRAIRSRAPRARILIVEYPEIFPRFPVDPVDGFNAALAGSVPAAALSLVMSCNSMIGDNIFPWDLIWLSHEQREANAMFRRTVEGAGVGAEYVSMDRFVGHDSCQEFGAWLHAGNMGHGFKDFVYSFHPNERGQREMYEAIKEHLSQERPEDGGFRFTIGAGDIVRRMAMIGGQQVAKAVFSHWWPGSDVELQLRSPAGRVIGRDTVADDVEHSLTGTFESYTIEDPEPGEWELTFRGVEVDLGGEPVGFQVAEIPEANMAPTPLFRQSTNGGPTGTTVSFDASESSDSDGTIEEYEWNFGDGAFGSGVEVDHAFEQPGRYTVRLLVRDDEGQPALHAQEEIWIRDQPRAVADDYGVDAGGELSVSAATGLLANDTVDRSGGEPRIELVSGVTHGTLELDSGGGFLYRPDAGFTGTDTMVYKLSDAGGLVSAPASARIDVRGAPVDPKTPGPGPGTPPPGGGAPPASGPPPSAPAPKPKVLKCKKGFKKKKVRGKLKCVKAKKKQGKKKR
ncbi:MAG TPA: PKD domain-containing protein [Solirubrobacterales bacterium]|nr:PKD domain-containing protein [Solirubrobacterales bacterium]